MNSSRADRIEMVSKASGTSELRLSFSRGLTTREMTVVTTPMTPAPTER